MTEIAFAWVSTASLTLIFRDFIELVFIQMQHLHIVFDIRSCHLPSSKIDIHTTTIFSLSIAFRIGIPCNWETIENILRIFRHIHMWVSHLENFQNPLKRVENIRLDTIKLFILRPACMWFSIFSNIHATADYWF